MSFAGCNQVRQKDFRAVDDAPVVDVHHSLEVLELTDLDASGVRDAGVVVDLVDRAEVVFDNIGVHMKRLALGHVEPIGFHRRADCPQPLLGPREAFGVDVDSFGTQPDPELTTGALSELAG